MGVEVWYDWRKKEEWMKRMVLVLAAAALRVMAWDVEHDEVAQLTGEFLPAEVKKIMTFDDFGILLANCHFPDMTEWPCENGRRRFHTYGELAAGAGEANAKMLAEEGFNNSNWFHSPRGKAALMTALARSFGRGEHAEAAFCISALSHAVSDESALNHPPLLGFFRYSRLEGIDFTMRKVEEGAKNVFGFRSDGHIVHLVRERMKGYEPRVPEGTFGEALLKFAVEIAVVQSAHSGDLEGVIAFAEREEAEKGLADLVAMQVKTMEDIVATCWRHRSAEAAAPGKDFGAKYAKLATEAVKLVDPATQSVFKGVFDEGLNPAGAKGTVGVVCEAYSRGTGRLSFPGRILTAAAARTMRANGFAVKALNYWGLQEKFPDPKEVPVVLMCIGGAKYMSAGPNAEFAEAAKEYRRKGGKLVVVGGEDVHDITGFAGEMKRRGNAEVPASSSWHKGEAGEFAGMSLRGTGLMKRLGSGRRRLVRDPNFDGFCKPVCRMEVCGGEALLELDNGRERFAVGAAKGGVVWLPEYALMPYLFVEGDPKLPLDALTLDGFGEAVLMDALRAL